MLDLREVNKTYIINKNENCVAIKGVNLSLPSCGMVFILGKSGSGKSTLLNLIGGLDVCDSGGDILLNNKSLSSFTDKQLDAYRNTCVGFVFQECNMLEDFSIFDNILLSLNLQNRDKDYKKVSDVLKKLKIEEIKDRKPSEISGGQKQRVAIARAIVKDPNIILCDEPTGNLDSILSKDIFKILKKLSKDKLVVVVSHDVDSAEKYADRIIELSDGRVVRDEDCLKSRQSILYEENKIIIPKNKKLTSKDIKNINVQIQKSKSELVIKNAKLKKKKEKKQEEFKDITLKQYKISPKYAFRVAFKNITIKPVRLIFTILLMIISMSLFGLGQIFNSYNIIESSVKSFRNNNITNIVLKQGEYSATFNSFNNNAEKEISLQSMMAIENAYDGVIDCLYSAKFQFGKVTSDDILSTILSAVGKDLVSPYVSKTNGLLVTQEEKLSNFFENPKVLGEYPSENSSCIAITDYLADCLIKLRVVEDNNFDDKIDYEDILGHNIKDVLGFNLKVLGILETGYTEKHKDILLQYNNDINSFATHKDYDAFVSDVQNYYSVIYTSNENYIRNFIVENINYSSIENYKIKRLDGEYVNNSVLNTNLSSVGYVFNIDGFYSLFDLDEKTDTEKSTVVNKLFSPNAFTYINNYDNAILISLEEFNNLFETEYTEVSDFDFNYFEDSELRIKIGEFEPLDANANPYNETDAIVVGIYDFSNENLDGLNVNADIISTVLKGVANSNFIKQFNMTHMSKIGLYVNMPESFSDSYKLIKAANNNYMYHSTEISKNIYLVSNIFSIFTMVIKWVALILAIFSVILLVNFVAHSIMQRKKEIGLFRAIGASGIDITKIFLIEVSVILFFVIIFAILFMWLGTIGLNSLLVSGFMGYLKSASISKISLLSMGVLPVVYVVGVTILLGVFGVIVPLIKFIKMKPVDVIKRR